MMAVNAKIEHYYLCYTSDKRKGSLSHEMYAHMSKSSKSIMSWMQLAYNLQSVQVILDRVFVYQHILSSATACCLQERSI